MYDLDTPIALHSRGFKNTHSHEPVPGGLLYPPVLEKLARWLSNRFVVSERIRARRPTLAASVIPEPRPHAARRRPREG
jgi:hypothetical protein